ncbi:related to serine/threonine-protein kinase [Cephalotrichum gorgonifer]|uniref:Related to serine/threonine-protein kinase n=1 Tax=Cephalotrichum gorgonifer TaxID=2041049 RepID=A0AAE8MX69_9PEZI|nr:related to serine/threonine-protein kinase [Cephalotrichum gorgonifer]
MSTIQQLKNFIRHGKQARVEQEAEKVVDVPAPPQPSKANPIPPQSTSDTQSAADAHHAKNGKSKRIDEINISKLVAEENETKSRFPKYPGLERWRLLEKMGDGAFSNVYRALDLEGHHGEAAIKVVRKFEMNNMQRSNILKEVQIMRQLDHPNIVKLLEFSESREYYYIVLELAPGGELFHQIVRLTYFSEDLSRHVITQVAKALLHLHEEKGIVHRDIKPENILFSPIPVVASKHPKPTQPGDEDKVDEGEFIKGVGAGGIGQIKIADFGLSKVIWETETMTPCGTVGYTAPEIVKDERYSKSVDMWALGCVLYTLLCGFPPFYDESIEVLTEKVAKGQYTFLSPWWDVIDKSAQDLITHLLTVDPDKRYTIKEFLAHPWIQAAGPTPSADERPTPEAMRAFTQANRLAEGDKVHDFRSPAAVNLREVFDVSYAVHRQEEEANRRRQLGVKAAAAPEQLEEVAEADEEDSSSSAEQMDLDRTGTRTLEASMRNANLQDRDSERRGRERERAAPPPAQEKGYGQHSAAVAAAARQEVRNQQRQKGVFELSLDGATLLGRRGIKPAAKVGGA